MIAMIAAGVVCLFLARAVVHKLISRAEFQATLSEYRLLPHSWARWMGSVLVAAEAAALGALLLVPTRPMGAVLAGLLFTAYAGAMVMNLLRGRSRFCPDTDAARSW